MMGDLRRARLGTAVVFLICGIGHGSWTPRLAEIKAQIGASDGEMGLALLMLGFGAMAAMPLAGRMIGRFGSRGVSIAAAVAYGPVFPLVVFAWDWISLGAAMLLLGVVVASLDVAMNVQATEIEERYGRPIMSSFHGLFSVGYMAGAFCAGLAASFALGLVPHFFIIAPILLLAGVGGCRLMIADPARGQESGDKTPAFVRPSGVLVLIGAIAFAALLAEGSIGDWSAIYLTEYQAADTSTAAWALTIFALAMAIMRFLGDRLVTRFGPFAILQSSGALAAAGLTIALLAGSPAVAIIGYGIAGLGIAVLFPVALSVAPKVSKMSTGSSVAAVAMLGYGGFLAGPPVIGLLADRVGLPLALGIVVLLTAAIPPLAWLAGRHVRARRSAEELEPSR